MPESSQTHIPETEKKNSITDESIYAELLRRSGGTFSGNPDAIAKFEPIYIKLHSLGQRLLEAYQEISSQFGFDPGEINVVLGGGRAKGKPFKDDSDLDIFFYVENPKESIDHLPSHKHPNDPLAAMDERIIKKQMLLEKISLICTEENIPNKFHILGFGAKIPEKYLEDAELVLAKTHNNQA